MRKMTHDELAGVGAGLLPTVALTVVAAIGLASFGFALGMSLKTCPPKRVVVDD